MGRAGESTPGLQEGVSSDFGVTQASCTPEIPIAGWWGGRGDPGEQDNPGSRHSQSKPLSYRCPKSSSCYPEGPREVVKERSAPRTRQMETGLELGMGSRAGAGLSRRNQRGWDVPAAAKSLGSTSQEL